MCCFLIQTTNGINQHEKKIIVFRMLLKGLWYACTKTEYNLWRPKSAMPMAQENNMQIGQHLQSDHYRQARKTKRYFECSINSVVNLKQKKHWNEDLLFFPYIQIKIIAPHLSVPLFFQNIVTHLSMLPYVFAWSFFKNLI